MTMEARNDVNAASKEAVQNDQQHTDVAHEKARLEVEKLRAEIDSLKRSNSWWDRLDRNAALLTVLITVISLCVGVYQFTRSQEANRKQLTQQAAQEEAARKEQLKRAYWEEQKKIYEEASNYAAVIANANSLKDVVRERGGFWVLYWGKMSLLEHTEVESAMVEFGEALKQWETTAKKPQAIENLSYRLAHCMRQSLSETWSPVFGYVKDAACPWGVSR